MDRSLLALSSVCYLLAFGRTAVALAKGRQHQDRFNLWAILAGFGLQTVFLYQRGQVVGRCPITNLFEILVFLSWSIGLAYLIVGRPYRLSLLGAFTAPLVLTLQAFALLAPLDQPAFFAPGPPDPWLEMHAALSLIAYGVFGLAAVAGVMYLLQEKQLKSRRPGSLFHALPPVTALSEAMRRLMGFGLVILTAGIAAGLFVGVPISRIKAASSVLVWVLYAAILLLWHLRALAPRRAAILGTTAFFLALLTLPAMQALTTYLEP